MLPVFRINPATDRFGARFGRDLLAFLRFAAPMHAPHSDESLRSVSEMLRRRAAARASQTAFVFNSEGTNGVQEGQTAWTYGELDRRAAAIAVSISRHAEPGDRAVLAFPPGLEFIAAFFGCLYAGVLPAPAPYPKPRRPSSRLDAIVADCRPRLALSTADMLGKLRLDDQSTDVRNLHWLPVDECRDAHGFTAPVARNLTDAAFLQYTSGSTSQPRGVIVTHGNLLHNMEQIRQGFGEPADGGGQPPSTCVSWLPAYHDMGLIGGIMLPLYVGNTTHLLAPATFLQRPMAWLETISHTQAAISGAPNFAFEHCVRKTTPEQRASLDLSRWRLAFCGAEPIDATALREFAAAMAPAGFDESAFLPCYGLAESTLMVACGRAGGRLPVLNADRSQLAAGQLTATDDAAKSQPLVSCGRPVGETEIRIVDPQSFASCRNGSIGEIWVRSDSVAAGYWDHPEELWQTFGGRLADGGGPYLRTGDLGALYNGELFVTGRSKDLIIIRGRNLYPQDIERTAQRAHAAVELGTTFSVRRDGHEQLVIVHQVSREHRRDDLTPVIRAIRAAVVEEHEVDPSAIVLLKTGALPLTSSGKVQRRKCRELFEAGGLEPLASWIASDEPSAQADEPGALPSESGSATNVGMNGRPAPEFLDRLGGSSVEELTGEVLQWMLGWLAEHAETPGNEVGADASFAELGMDSLTALELNVEFENVLGVRLPPAAAWSYPTPASLSKYLAETMLGLPPSEARAEGPIDSWLASMEEDGSRQ